MSISTELQKLGSGTGIIYLTDSLDVIQDQFLNDETGRGLAERLMLISSPLVSNISASSLVEVTANGGTITNLSYNGVSVFDVSTPVSGATVEDLATALSLAINSHVSTPEYTASVSGAYVTVYLAADSGDSLNGTVAAFSTTGTVTMTGTGLDGGSYPTSTVDAQVGYKMYLNSLAAAPSGSLVGATDVTSAVLRTSAASPYSIKDVEIASGGLDVERDGAVTVVNVQTEGAIAADDLETINAGIFSSGDIILLRGQDAAKVSTLVETGNIVLANSASFATGNRELVIGLQYFNDVTPTWYEIFRSPGADLSVANLRSSGIATPVQGVEVVTLATSGGTVNLTPGVDKGYYVLAGTGTLTGSWNYTLASGLVDGDTFIIDYNATMTPSGNTVTLFGNSLTDDQVLGGSVIAVAVWSGVFSAWVVSLVRDTTAVDLVDTTVLALKEDLLGNPAADGYILSSTAAGVRSWIQDSTDIVLDGNSGTAGQVSTGVEVVLRSIPVPAGTLPSNGSLVMLDVYGTFGANANAKALRLKFDGNIICENIVTTAPNGSIFHAQLAISRSSSFGKCTGNILMSGLVSEAGWSQIGSLNFDTTSYTIEVTGEGLTASDVVVYHSIATKLLV